MEEYADCPTSLALFLSSYYLAASFDLRDVTVGELYDRFIEWRR